MTSFYKLLHFLAVGAAVSIFGGGAIVFAAAGQILLSAALSAAFPAVFYFYFAAVFRGGGALRLSGICFSTCPIQKSR